MKRLLALPLALWLGHSQAALIYSDDFDGAVTIHPGVTVSGPSGGSLGTVSGGPYTSGGKSWSGRFYGMGNSLSLTLNNLPSHTHVSIDFILGYLNSWDSTNGTITPDYLKIIVDGISILTDLTSNNTSGTVTNYGGGTVFVSNGQVDSHFYAPDVLVDMATASALTFAHTGSSLTFEIEAYDVGWQGWPDEGFGIDALSISVSSRPSPAPAPATLALLGVGLLGLGLTRRSQPM